MIVAIYTSFRSRHARCGDAAFSRARRAWFIRALLYLKVRSFGSRIAFFDQEMTVDMANRYQHLDRILTRSGPFVDSDSFTPGAQTQQFLREECKILVIGQ